MPGEAHRTVSAGKSQLADIRRRIREDGLIAVVGAPVPGLDVLAVGDGLLASPILVMEIGLGLPDAVAIIGQLRQRFGRHMLIGAGDVTTAADVETAVAAGAQFVTLSGPDAALVVRAQAAGVLAMPAVRTPDDIGELVAAGGRMLHLAGTAPDLARLSEAWPGIEFVVAADSVAGYGPAWRAAGVCAVQVSEGLFGGASLTQAQLITRARRLRGVGVY